MGKRLGILVSLVVMVFLTVTVEQTTAYRSQHRNAYATMMYMGTARDYEFYVAIRVMIRSLVKLRVDADLVVIASVDVPLRWVQALEQEDGAKVVTVENVDNPYQNQTYFTKRFKLTLNKLYAWNLVDYDRVVMLDADNLFLQKTDELFQCGQFCAVFINPCIFHTGLFVLQMGTRALFFIGKNKNLLSRNRIIQYVEVIRIKGEASILKSIIPMNLQPSLDVFRDLLHEVEIGRKNRDGADQGFMGSYFTDLLDQPMFHPPLNGSKLEGTYRLPLGYQMDASYYYLRLKWHVPCGPNSVITFPGASWLKPWYWWAWPVLPLGIQWHEQRRQTLGYSAEMPVVFIQSIFYLGIMAVTRLARPNLSKLCYRRADKSTSLIQASLKLVALWCILAAYIIPFFLIPCTVHPLLGWSLYLLGAFSLSSIAVNAFLLPILPVLVPWLGILGTLLVMAYPWYPNGIVRALSVFGYAFCCAPVLWGSLVKIMSCLQVSLEREAFLPRLGESSSPPEFKLY